MRRWALLAAAIATEVTGTLALRAFQDQRLWIVVVVAGYTASFAFLSAALRAGMPVGVAYGIWAAVGTALIAVLGSVIFDEPFTAPVIAGIALILAGVLMVELGSRPAAES